MTPPGWYADPHVPGQLRWWDGATWTAHVTTAGGASPTGPGAPTPATTGANRTGLVIGAIAAASILVVVVLVGAVTLLGNGSRQALPTPTTSPRSTATTSSSPTPTSEVVDATLADRAERANVPLLDEEGVATHTHTLLKITVDGDEIVIPAGVGIDDRRGRIAALHTHEDHGVLHVESPTRGDTYTLGQFLELWGAGGTQEAVCEHFVSGPCSLDVATVAPTASDQIEFQEFGDMPDVPPAPAEGLETVLEQGLVIELTITRS